MSGLAEIEARRRAGRVTIESLCSGAGISQRCYYHVLAGAKTMRPSTLARLAAALDRLERPKWPAHEWQAHSVYLAALTLAAEATGGDLKAALASDPARRATASPAWLAAAKLRRLAVWIANSVIGFPQAEISRAAGMSRQAICNAVKAIEDDPSLAALRARLDAAMSERAAELSQRFDPREA